MIITFINFKNMTVSFIRPYINRANEYHRHLVEKNGKSRQMNSTDAFLITCVSKVAYCPRCLQCSYYLTLFHYYFYSCAGHPVPIV